MLAAMRWVVGRLPRGLRASDADRPVRVYAVPVPERPSVVHSSHYPPEPVYQVRRKIDRSVVQRLLSGLSAIMTVG
jgi:hypothetical protein